MKIGAQMLAGGADVREKFFHVTLDEAAVDEERVLAPGDQHGIGREEAFLAGEHVKAQAVGFDGRDHFGLLPSTVPSETLRSGTESANGGW